MAEGQEEGKQGGDAFLRLPERSENVVKLCGEGRGFQLQRSHPLSHSTDAYCVLDLVLRAGAILKGLTVRWDLIHTESTHPEKHEKAMNPGLHLCVLTSRK